MHVQLLRPAVTAPGDGTLLAYIVDGIILNIGFWLLVTIFGIDMFGGMLDGDPAAMAAASGAMFGSTSPVS